MVVFYKCKYLWKSYFKLQWSLKASFKGRQKQNGVTYVTGNGKLGHFTITARQRITHCRNHSTTATHKHCTQLYSLGKNKERGLI